MACGNTDFYHPPHKISDTLVLVNPRIPAGARRDAVIAAARDGGDLDEDVARHVRVTEYDVPGRGGNATVLSTQYTPGLPGLPGLPPQPNLAPPQRGISRW